MGPRRVVLVHPDLRVLLDARERLASSGAEVVVATRPRDALVVLRRCHVDVLVAHGEGAPFFQDARRLNPRMGSCLAWDEHWQEETELALQLVTRRAQR